ncbi:MAG: hypothetical protein JWO31_2635, partial [Phycisphaerales bacterium]|nr:hypothetical protein [Phycisphaerales bacterium]
HLQSWDEGANSNGHPNGAVVRGPVYQRGEVVENFLIDNPDAAGMVAN